MACVASSSGRNLAAHIARSPSSYEDEMERGACGGTINCRGLQPYRARSSRNLDTAYYGQFLNLRNGFLAHSR